MPITLKYHTFDITKKERSEGGFDVPMLKKNLCCDVDNCEDEIRSSSGIYIYYRKTKGGGWKADYVGKNTTYNLLGEALSKKFNLANDILPRKGSHKILFISCRVPKGMQWETVFEDISNLEAYLINILRVRKHPLLNVQYARKKPSFTFNLTGKNHNGQSAFKNLAGKKEIWL